MSEMKELMEQLSIIQGTQRKKTDEPKFYLCFDNEEIPKEIVQKFAKNYKKAIKLNREGIAIVEQFFGTRNRKVITKRLVLYLLAMSEKAKQSQ